MMKKNKSSRKQQKEDKFYSGNENDFIAQRKVNIKCDIITITHDKLENILLKYLQNFKKSKSWINPLSISITLILTICTADFKNTLGLQSETWKALFIWSTGVSIVWFIYTICNIRSYAKKTSIEYLINIIKNYQEKQ